MVIDISDVFNTAYKRVLKLSKVKGNYTPADAQKIRRAFVSTILQEMQQKSMIDFGYMILKPKIKEMEKRYIKHKRYLIRQSIIKRKASQFFVIK